MKILLINPKFPDTFWSFKYALGFIGKKSAFPPLGLLTVAALLPEDWEKRLVDTNIEKLRERDLDWADMVFMGGMTIQKPSAIGLMQRCKRKGLKIAAGGPLFSTDTAGSELVDHLFLGEAELTLASFVEDLKEGCPQDIYRASGFCDIRRTPAPLWGLLRMGRYASMSLQFSRGCPFNCDFCNVTVLFGHRPRIKTAGQITAELDGLYDAGWRGNIFFVDDNFIGNKHYLKTDLLPAIINWRRNKRGYVFFTEASINLADDPELLDMMARAGFDSVFIGIESPDEESLKECRKFQNNRRDLLGDVRKIHRSGLQVMGGFIVGFDNDAPSIFQRQVDFIQSSNIVTAMVGLLQAPPGTRLFERLTREKRLRGDFSGNNVGGDTNIIPKMGMERLQEGYRTMMQQLYTPGKYYQRVRSILKELKMPQAYVPMSRQRLLAFVRSSLRIGVFGKERLHYWHLLAWALLRKPRAFPLAVSLAIYGYHFRKICELHIY
jgi:radical SAM superfamily enzyme YgiQ (UPF0313 family)